MERDRGTTAGDRRGRRVPAPGPVPAPGRIASVRTAPLQCYRTVGAARISDGNKLAVVDQAPHNVAYAAAEKIEALNGGPHSGASQIELSRGPAAPATLGLDVGCVQVLVRQRDSAAATRQRDGSRELAMRYRAAAHAEKQQLRSKLLWPTPWHVLTGSRGPVTPRGFDMRRAVTGDRNVMAPLEATYLEIVRTGFDFTPAHVRSVAQRHGVPTTIIYLLMQETQAYHQGIVDEYEDDGMTTPNDCDHTANGFVVAGDLRKYTLPQAEDRGYAEHFFSLLFHDGEDHIALENAVGTNRFEQLYKQAPYDHLWKWQMRGSHRPAEDAGAGREETRGVGVQIGGWNDATRDSVGNRRLDLLDLMRNAP